MATITKTYTDGAGNVLDGTVTFVPYTFSGPTPVPGTPVVVAIPGNGVVSQALTNNTVYAVTERLRKRAQRDMVIRTTTANGTLESQERYGSAVEARLMNAPAGAKGDTGPAGADGAGVPAGGADGQVLVKASAADYDTEWIDPA